MDPTSRTPTDLFASVRGRLGAIVALSVLAAVTRVVPLIGIVELAKALWPMASGQPVDARRAWAILAIMAGAMLVSFASGGVGLMISHLADADLQHDLRTRIVRHLRTLPLGWFDVRSSGAVRKVAQNDVSALHQLVAHAIQDVILALGVPVLSLGYLFATEWRMALACLVPIALFVVLYALMMRGGKEKYAQYDASVVQLNSATIEYVHGIAVVKTFGQAGRSHRRYRDETRDFIRFYDGWMQETSRMQSLIEILTSPVVVLTYLAGVGGWLVAAGVIVPLDVLPALLVGLCLSAPLLQLGFSAQYLRAATKATGSLREFFAEPPIPAPAGPLAPTGSDVELAGVSFSYDGERPVLRDISAACAPGTVTALVGASGSGKSSLARLVPRFYDVDAGQVAIGGVDVRRIASDRLYREVGFVFQDAYLLRASIRDNIRLTRPDATEEQVEAAARAAQIHERIGRLPRGYDSVIGVDAQLSGGEEQRLTIARALITDAPILVLDEATAFADPDSEAAIQTALTALAASRSILVIAHRLHTITNVEQILVLDDGRIVERGTHQELTKAAGTYARMWRDYEAARGEGIGVRR